MLWSRVVLLYADHVQYMRVPASCGALSVAPPRKSCSAYAGAHVTPHASHRRPSCAGVSSWDASSTPRLTPARAGSGGGGSSKPFVGKTGVRFAGADASPALTPSWRSNAWANPGSAAQQNGDGRERSPDLKEDLGRLLNDEEVRNNEQQLDRDWYDRCG